MNPEQHSEEDYETIDLLELARLLLHNLRWVLLATVAGAGLAFGITQFLITPQYTATSMILILSKTTSITSLADLQIGSQLTADFQVLATSRPVVDSVIQTLGLQTTYEDLVPTITLANPSDTRILKINVDNLDPQLAADISNTLADALCTRVAEVMNTDRPSLVEQAVVPRAPSSPNVFRNTAIGGLLGLVAAVGLVVLRHLLNDTIKTEEDVTKYLGLNTLAAFPLEKRRARSGRAKKRSNQAKKAEKVPNPEKMENTVTLPKAVNQ